MLRRWQAAIVSAAFIVALAQSEKCYVIYLPHGGDVSVDLAGAKDELKARWFNPRSGVFGSPKPVQTTDSQ